jgi:hypothetical protein
LRASMAAGPALKVKVFSETLLPRAFWKKPPSTPAIAGAWVTFGKYPRRTVPERGFRLVAGEAPMVEGTPVVLPGLEPVPDGLVVEVFEVVEPGLVVEAETLVPAFLTVVGVETVFAVGSPAATGEAVDAAATADRIQTARTASVVDRCWVDWGCSGDDGNTGSPGSGSAGYDTRLFRSTITYFHNMELIGEVKCIS